MWDLAKIAVLPVLHTDLHCNGNAALGINATMNLGKSACTLGLMYSMLRIPGGVGSSIEPSDLLLVIFFSPAAHLALSILG